MPDISIDDGWRSEGAGAGAGRRGRGRRGRTDVDAKLEETLSAVVYR